MYFITFNSFIYPICEKKNREHNIFLLFFRFLLLVYFYFTQIKRIVKFIIIKIDESGCCLQSQ